MGAALREVVRRREAERRLQLSRSPRRGGARKSGRIPLRGRAGRRAGRDHLLDAARGGRQGGKRAQGPRRRKGNAGRDLHGHGPGAARGDARVRAPGRASHGRIRRLLRRGALRPAERHALRGPAHAGRKLAPRPGRPAEGECRRGARDLSARADGRGRAADAGGRSDARGAGHDLVAARRGPVVRCGDVPVRADGRRGPPLPPVHERHHREAERHRAHDRRLPRRGRDDAPLHLRSQAGVGRLLVRGGHRLGDGPQLRASCTRARRTSRTRTAGGTSSSDTASRSCIRRRPRSARI